MPKVAVVYHSGFGHTKAVASSIARGAAGVDGVDATLINVDDLPPPASDRTLTGLWTELDAADAIIMGCPTYMGSVSARFKVFMETSGGIWGRQGWKDKLADQTPPPEDHRTAELFGERVARAAVRWVRGRPDQE